MAQPLIEAYALEQSADPGRFEIEVITIRPAGFEPQEITRPKGPFGLAVENRTGLENVILRLDREGGGRLQERQVTRKELNWKQRVNLPPGTYTLTEANNPDWVCRITITDN